MRGRAVAAALAVTMAMQPLAPRLARADDPPAAGNAPARGDEAPRRPRIESPDGVLVTFVSKDPAMVIYLAHGDVPARTFPDPFEKIGLVPLTVKLAPGQYTIETASAKSSTGHERLTVESNAPVTVDVHGGDAMVKAFGGVFIALGVIATILGVVAIVSISPNDAHYNRWAVGLPLVGGGVGLAALGVGMTAAGSTDIVAPHLPPGGMKGRPTATWVPGLTLRF